MDDHPPGIPRGQPASEQVEHRRAVLRPVARAIRHPGDVDVAGQIEVSTPFTLGAHDPSGHRESTESWAAVLRDLKRRGLRAPKRTIADGHLGIWSALATIYPESAEQRCWNHKLRNVLDTVPLKHQAEVKAALHAIASADTAREATAPRDDFTRTCRRAHPKAVERLARDWERMITYYACPQAHWKHLRTTNIIESPFAAVRLRTSAEKRFTKVENATALIWKTLLVVEQHFRKLNAPHLCTTVYDGATYRDGVLVGKRCRQRVPILKVPGNHALDLCHSSPPPA